ncbi:MAG: sulfatase-like hydrolase/transferase [Edaphobacter sp.]|uniref:sulfatase-like hydrolase/transferase n=1 Tax=Edaphobacter sp. TaxID=1934404 RepID=UPI0023976FF2|nr:sulfatase-like hydrolase/transferase [Edaphobacter sp.]MDE1178145.1 sulfatase-like hydrolase/transferase [Edaphobacter sp.]
MKSLAAISASAAVTVPANAQKAASNPTSRKRPNILVFLTDDHGQWLQEAYGNSEVHTPNMSRLARDGVRMDNAFTTCPVCSPARASFFTGRMPSQHGIHDWIEEKTQAYAAPWLKGQTLISELLQDAGYHTGLVGKWHCGFERDPHPGFDEWFCYWENQYPHNGTQNFSDNGKHVTAEGLQSALLTDQALRFLRSHAADRTKKEKPFFLFVGYTDTHSPHAQMPEEMVAAYKKASFRDIPREVFCKEHGTPLIPVTGDAAAERSKHEQYYAAASTIDREVGRLLDELESTGELENTLVVYTGDHGLNAGHHGMWEKGNATIPQNFLEESIRVPCTISWPKGGLAQGLSCDAPVNHCDLFATLLDVAGAAPDAKKAKGIHSPGRSYLPLLQGDGNRGSTAHNAIFCEYGNARMIRLDGYKLIVRYPYQGVRFPNEFYDLKADPRETENVYSAPEHAATIRAMEQRLNEYFTSYSVAEHDGLHLERQPMATPASPWLASLKH